MSGIMLGNSPAKLYLGDILLTGGGGYTDEDICDMVCDSITTYDNGASWAAVLAAMMDNNGTKYATYYRVQKDVAWDLLLYPTDFSADFKKIKSKIRLKHIYASQGTYLTNGNDVKNLIPNTYTYNVNVLNVTSPCRFRLDELSAMGACHPAISSRYTLTDGGWYDFTDDEWDFPDLITLGGLTASSQLMIVKFYSGTVYAFTYPNGVTPAITDDGTNYNIENIASRATISDLFNTAYTAKITPSYTTGAGFYMGKDAVNNVVMASTFDLVCNGVTIFAKNADITDFVAT